ncbi:MAG: HAMP domain-containing histidine kinase [Acidobacteria bacterium]|nr:HAMP domain-containing histidine kinase [Acidobacteriota bacterium]
MSFWRQPALRMSILIAVLLALLALLATLQYRWMGEVSEAELQRMRSSLRADVFRLTQEFDGELTRIYRSFNLQVDFNDAGDSFGHYGWLEDQYAHRYRQWLAVAPYPRLVHDLFWVDMDRSDELRISRFNRETNHLELSSWPAELADWRGRFTERLRNRGMAFRPSFGTALDPTVEDLPELVIPLRHRPRFSDGPRLNPPAIVGFSVVRLDRIYLEQEFVPALARRYFPGTEGMSDYALVIVSRRNPERIIYQSDPKLSASVRSSPDAAATFFTLRFEALQNRPADGFSGRIDRPGSFRRGANFAAPGLPPIPAPRPEGRWQLTIKHRGGSLKDVVGSARRRNLMISFTVLMLLGTSMTLIIIVTQRAQKLARQQMDFVAGVSHELRTPLAVVCSAGENLADGIIRDQQQVKQYGGLVLNEGRRLTRMVEQILEFAGIQSGRRIYEMRPIRPGQLIDSALAACEPHLKEADIQLQTEIENDLPLIKGDSAALIGSIQNLLINAIKYGGVNRWIKLQAQAMTGKRGQEVRITIEDKGLGIARTDLPHIFDPFYRGRVVLAAQIHGNGLGLSLVKSAIEAHGGRVTVKSSPGQGSVFTLHFPALPRTARESFK